MSPSIKILSWLASENLTDYALDFLILNLWESNSSGTVSIGMSLIPKKK